MPRPMDNLDPSPYDELLRITEKVLMCLERDEDEGLVPLLRERRKAFRNIHGGVGGHPPPDAASWIKRIRECEDRCTCLARKKEDLIRQELKANKNRLRLGNTYRRSRSVRLQGRR